MRIVDLIERDMVVPHLKGKTKTQILRELAQGWLSDGRTWT